MHNRVYLLGAGFSRAISPEMPTTNDLSIAVRTALRDLDLPGVNTPLADNFERWLSYLVETPPWLPLGDRMRNLAAFNDVAGAVHTVLVERQDTAVAGGACPPWLTKLVRYWNGVSATVITFNYDLFVELALAIESPSFRTTHPGLLPIPPVMSRSGTVSGGRSTIDAMRLLKLHGSLNWRYSGPDSPPGDLIYDMGINESKGWSIDALMPADPETELQLSDREPMIVPPAAVKSSYYNNRTLRALWMSAAEALQRADELVLMGFSLSVTDLLVASMLTTNLPQTATITPVNYSGDVVERVRETFGLDQDLDDDRLVDTYTDLGDAAIPSWVERFANLA